MVTPREKSLKRLYNNPLLKQHQQTITLTPDVEGKYGYKKPKTLLPGPTMSKPEAAGYWAKQSLIKKEQDFKKSFEADFAKRRKQLHKDQGKILREAAQGVNKAMRKESLKLGFKAGLIGGAIGLTAMLTARHLSRRRAARKKL